MPRIFISYRREDSSGYAGRIYDRLSSRFGPASVFMDIDTLEPGTDFVKVLRQRVEACDICIAIIGKGWLAATDEQGQRRLLNPEDFVRLEIGAALERQNIRVVPVLVGGARMPRSTELPPELSELSRRHALDVPDVGFHQVLGRLIQSIERGEQERVAREEAEAARRVEQERVAREKAEAARRVEQERVAREKAEAARLPSGGQAPSASPAQTGRDGAQKPASGENWPQNIKLSGRTESNKYWNRLSAFRFPWRWAVFVASWAAFVVAAFLLYRSLTAPPGTVQVPPAPTAEVSSTAPPGTVQAPSLPPAESGLQSQAAVELKPEATHEDATAVTNTPEALPSKESKARPRTKRQQLPSRPPPANAEKGVRVQITAQEQQLVWVSARSDGKFLFAVTLEPNESRTVEAKQTVLLKLGNAGGADFSLNGKPIIGGVGPKGQIRSVQFTSGGFQIVLPDVSNPPAPKDLLDDPF